MMKKILLVLLLTILAAYFTPALGEQKGWNQVRAEVARENAQKSLERAESFTAEGKLKQAFSELKAVLKNLEEIKSYNLYNDEDVTIEQQALLDLKVVKQRLGESLSRQAETSFQSAEHRLKSSEIQAARGYYQKTLDSLAELEKVRTLDPKELELKSLAGKKLSALKARTAAPAAPLLPQSSSSTTSLPQPPAASSIPAESSVPAQEAPLEAEVIINSNPKGATLLLDNQLDLTTPARLTLPTGNYQIKLAKPGFKPISGQIEVKPGRVNLFTYNFRKEYVGFFLTSNPAQAQVLIDGQVKGLTNCNIKVSVGEHQLILRKEGWAEWRETLQVLPQTPAVISRNLAPAENLTGLELNSDPQGAEVNLDGQVIGSTPLTRQTTTGKHALKLSLPGYRSEVRALEAAGGQPNRVMIFLTRGVDPEPSPSPEAGSGPGKGKFSWAAAGLFSLAVLILGFFVVMGLKSSSN